MENCSLVERVGCVNHSGEENKSDGLNLCTEYEVYRYYCHKIEFYGS